jgi:hypothetical protein
VTRVSTSEGVNASERYLTKLCRNSFLSLWSYPNLYGRKNQELCDLLVLFDNHVIIFSDKSCAFPNTGNLKLDWDRWFRRTVDSSARQIWGAERWIKSFPDRLFLNAACTTLFPLRLPEPSKAQFHRVLVAHGASEKCQAILGGSGSLIVKTDVIGQQHYSSSGETWTPFTVGSLDPSKGFIHILDDTSLDIVLSQLDTIVDFVEYLSKKELFFNTVPSVNTTGEEELLGFYLSRVDKNENHDFIIDQKDSCVFIDEGWWDRFIQSPEHKSQLEANSISYIWDDLIERFNKNIVTDSLNYSSHNDFNTEERLMRFLASAPRTRRRMLAKAFMELKEKTPANQRAARILASSNPDDTAYVFLLLPLREDRPDEEYRNVRVNLLQAYCMVTKLKFPEARNIVGIATESGIQEYSSEDALYYDANEWTDEEQKQAIELQQKFDLLNNSRFSKTVAYEYPYLPSIGKIGRNDSCPCGSGKKYKRCCMRKH